MEGHRGVVEEVEEGVRNLGRRVIGMRAGISVCVVVVVLMVVVGVVYVFWTMFLVSGRGELYRSGFFYGWRCHFWVEWVFCGGGGGGSWSGDGGGSGGQEFRTVSGVCYESVSVVFEWEGGFSRNIRFWCWWKWMCLMQVHFSLGWCEQSCFLGGMIV